MGSNKSLEVRNPQKAKKLIDSLSQPGATEREAAISCKVPKSTAHDIKKRNAGVIEARRAKKWGELDLVGLASQARDRAETALSKASAKDAAIVLGIAVEKGHLIEGKATSNVNIVHEHRHTLPGLLEAIQKSLERRGHTSIDGQVVEGELEE